MREKRKRKEEKKGKRCRAEESRWKRRKGGERLSISVLLLSVCTGMTAAN